MGTDTPLAVLSNQHPPLFNYFKQRFAQVTNPPIDAIREKVVTSTSVYIGAHGNLLEDKPENCKVLKVHNPILTSTDLLKIKYMNVPGFKVATVSINYYKNTSLEKAIDRVFLEVDRAYKDGANIIILSDRDVDEYHVTIPSLLAVSAVSQYLIRTKKSTALALILESAEPREVHHFATLLGYGACAINPYLAHETIGQLIDEGLLDKDYYAAVEDYDNAILSGIVKIASKMGISTIQSYQSSQIFEAVGISKDVIDKYFTGTVSRVGGITLADIQADVEARTTPPSTRWVWTSTWSWPTAAHTSSAAARKNTCSTPRPSTCSRKPAGRTTTRLSSSSPAPWTTWVPTACICAACWTSTMPPTAASRWKRWSR